MTAAPSLGAGPPQARRVLHCIPNLLNGGAQRQLVLLAAEQVRLGMDVHVAVVHSGPHAAALQATGARLHWIATGFNHDPRLLWRLVRVIRENRPDVVQSWLTQMDVLAGTAVRVTATPWVLSERCSILAYPRSPKNLARALLARGASAVVANSTGGDDYWRPRLPKSVRRRVVPNGIPLADIASAESISRAEMGLGADEKMVLHVGRLDPQKNIETLIPALDEAARRVPLVACLCGDGTHEEEAERLVRRHSSGGRIRLLGYRPDVWRLMKGADLMVSVSRFEGHPNAVLEAAACGCPMLLSDIPSHRESVGDDGAFFVNAPSPAEVAEALVRSLNDAAEARRHVEAARAKAEALSPAAMARGYMQVYAEVVEEHAVLRAA